MSKGKDDITKATWYGKKPNSDIRIAQLLVEHRAWVEAGAKGAPPHDFRGIDFERGILAAPTLTFADLKESNLHDTFLAGADLRGANLQEADLGRAKLFNAILINTNLEKANLQNAQLHNAVLTGANLRNANLTKADLDGADLRGADLTGAKLIGVDLSKAITDETPPQPQEKHKPNEQSNSPPKDANTSEKPAELEIVKEAETEEGRRDEYGKRHLFKDLSGPSLSLPQVDDHSRILAMIDKAASLSRKIYTPLLLACGYVFLDLAVISPNELVANKASITLPIVQAKVPLNSFCWASAVLLLGLYIYQFFYLIRTLELVARTPDVSSRGVPRVQLIDPWLVLGLVRVIGPWKVIAPKAVDWIQFLIIFVLVWLTVPAILVWESHLCIAIGDSFITNIQYSCFGLAVLSGVLFFFKSLAILNEIELNWEIVAGVCLTAGCMLYFIFKIVALS